MKVSVKRGSGLGNYDVFVDGEQVGEVQKIEQHYNIAPRALTVTYWRAFLTGVGQPVDNIHYRTRQEAVAALTAGRN